MNSLRYCRRLLRAVLLVSLSCCLVLVMCAPAGSAQHREHWQWPTLSPVPVASSFAPPVHDWMPGRRGVTLTYPGGSPVYACASGTVTFAGQVGGRGVISIQHETRGHTIWSTYLPVTPSVSVGETVTMGAQIGAVEEGSQTLHWGAKTGPKTYVDPIRLTVDRPRLLPWDGS